MEKKIAKIGIIMVLALALILSSLGALNLGDTFAKEFDVGEKDQTSVREWGGVSHSKLGASSNQLTAQAATTPTPWDGSIAAGFAGGDGAEATPYLIATGAELAYLAQQVNLSRDTNLPLQNKHFKLTADIVLNDISNLANWGTTPPNNKWESIGLYGRTFFKGTFDGDGHTVSGIYINVEKYLDSSVAQGLFGGVKETTIKNVGVINSYIKGQGKSGGSGYNYVGGVVGYNNGGKVINCYNTGVVTGNIQKGVYVGGVVGGNSGTVINCYNSGAVSGTAQLDLYGCYVGGVAGDSKMAGSKITNCYNSGAVTVTAVTGADPNKVRVGGVVGYAGDGTISVTNCYNSGAVNATGTTCKGGVVGNIDNGTVTNCYFLQDGAINTGLNAVGSTENFEGGTTTGTEANCSAFGANKQLTTAGSTAVGTNNVLVTFKANDGLTATLNSGKAQYNKNNEANPNAIKAVSWRDVRNSYPVLGESITIVGTNIYANGTGITLKAVVGHPDLTNIYYKEDLVNAILLDGLTPANDGYDLSGYTVYGGGNATATDGVVAVNGNTSVTMESGKITSIYGGGNGANATVTGNTSVTISGGTITGNVYGGGNDATVNGTKIINVSGAPKIGSATAGIIMNGGTTAVTNGVDQFVINGALTGAANDINLVLPSGFVNRTVATKDAALAVDVAKFALVGDGAISKALEINGTDKTKLDVVKYIKPLTKPTIGATTSVAYTGEDQAAALKGLITSPDIDNMTIAIAPATAIDFGEYTITVSINKDTYQWVGGGNEDFTFKTNITKATNQIDKITMKTWTYGETASTPTATANFGTPTFTYSNAQNGTYSGDVPTNAGNYWVKASVVGTTNYATAELTQEFTIAKAAIARPTAIGVLTYNGKSQTGVSEAVTGFAYSGETSGTNATTYKATANLDGNHIWSTGIDEAAKLAAHNIEWTIAKAPLTVSVSASPITKEYDGNNNATVTFNVVGLQNSETASATGTATYVDKNVGATKNITVTGINIAYDASAKANNYEYTPAEITTSGAITAKGLTVVWTGESGNVSDFSWVYSGAEIKPTATVDPGIVGETIALTVTGEQTNVGASAYTATAAMSTANANYTLLTTTQQFTITQKALTISGITANNKTYDGNTTATLVMPTITNAMGLVGTDAVTVTATGAFENADVVENKTVNISGLTLGGANVGNYVLNAAGQQATTTATISPATIGGTISATNYSAPYDGLQHGITVGTSLAEVVNLQPITTTYCETENGTYGSEIKFSDYTPTAKTIYYKVSAPNHTDVKGSATITITQATLTDATKDQSSVFDGSAKTFVVDATAVNNQPITYQYGVAFGTYSDTVISKTNVESITVYYKITAPNHADLEGNKTFSITKAALPAIGYPTAAGVTYGATLSTSILNGGSTDLGAFAWTTGAEIPTVVNSGYSVTFTPSDLTLQNYTCDASYTQNIAITVAPATITTTPFVAYSGAYDKTPHSITAGTPTTVNSQTATIKYSTDNKTWSTTNPAMTDVGTTTVHYKITAPNHTELTGSSTITITKTLNTWTTNLALSITNWTYGDAAGTLTTPVPNFGEAVIEYKSGANVLTGMPSNAGSYTVTATVAESDNFSTLTATVEFTIDKKALTIKGLTAGDKPYDGNTTATISGTAVLDGAIAADNTADKLAINGTVVGTFANKDTIGSAQNVSLSGLSVTGTSIDNYTFTLPTLSATISKREITVTWEGVATRVYDGVASNIKATVGNLISGDTCDLVVGNGVGQDAQAYTANIAAFTNAKYQMTTPLTYSYEITKRPVTITAENKTSQYKLALAELTNTVTGDGFIAADNITVSLSTDATIDSVVGSNYVITPTCVEPNTKLANYTVTINNGKYTIIPQVVENPIPASQSFIYNGVEQTYVITANERYTITGDKQTLANVKYTATVALNNKTNYEWNNGETTNGTDDLTFDWSIAKATPTLTAPIAAGVTYGQTLSASGLTGGKATITKGGTAETITVKGTFTWSAPDTNPTVTNSGYVVTFTPNASDEVNFTTATISTPIAVEKAVLTVTATDQTIIYGDPILQDKYTITGYKLGQDKNVVTGVPTLVSDITNVGPGTITASKNTLTADNYSFAFASGAVIINQREITVSPIVLTGESVLTKEYDKNTTYSGVLTKGTHYTLVNMVGTDDVDINFTTKEFNNANVGTANKVTASFDATLSETTAPNYKIAPASIDLNAKLTKKELTVTPNTTASIDKNYDGTPNVDKTSLKKDVHYTITGFVVDDNVDITVSAATYADKNVGEGKDVTVTYTLDTTTAVNYSTATSEMKLSGKIIGISAVEGEDFTVTKIEDPNYVPFEKGETKYFNNSFVIKLTETSVYKAISNSETFASATTLEVTEECNEFIFYVKKENGEIGQVVLKYGIDKKLPTIDATWTIKDSEKPEVSFDSWFKNNKVTVSIGNILDTGSGINWTDDVNSKTKMTLTKNGVAVAFVKTPNSVSFELNYTSENAINGVYVLTIYDYAGNSVATTITIDKHDNVAPTIAATIDGKAIDYTKWVGNGKIDFALSDAPSGIATKVWTADGITDATVADTFNHPFANGHHAFKLVLTDNAGNSTTLEKPLLVDDNIATFMTAYNAFNTEAVPAEKDKKAAALNTLFDGYTVTQKEHITGKDSSNTEAVTAYKALQTYITGRQKEIEAERISQETQRVKDKIAAITGAEPTTQSELEKFVKQLPISKEVEKQLSTKEKQDIADIVAVEKVVDLLNAKPNNNAQLENWLKTYNSLSETQKTLAQKVVGTLADRNTAYVGYKTAVDELIAGAKDLNNVNATNKVEVETLIVKYNALIATDHLPGGITSKALVPQNVAAKIEKLIVSIEKAAAVDGKIGAIGTVPADYNKDFNNKVVDAEKAYKELTADEKTLVTNVKTLEDAKKANEDLKKKLATSDKAAAEAADFESKFAEFPTKPTVKDVLDIYGKYEKLSTEAKALIDVTAKTNLDAWKTAADAVFTKDDTSKIINRIENIDLKKLENATAEEIAKIKTEIESVITDYKKLADKQKDLVDNTVGSKYDKLADLKARLDAAEKAINDIPKGNAEGNHTCGLCNPSVIGKAHNTDDHQTLIEKAKIAYEKLSATERKLLDSDSVTTIGKQYEILKDYLGKLAQQKIIKDKAEKENVSVYGLATLVDTSTVPDITIADTIVISVEAKKTDSKMTDMDEDKQKVISFDVKLMAKAGNNEAVQIQPKADQKVVVKLSLGKIYPHEKIEIYHNKNDGSRELVQNVNCIDEENQTYVIFETSSFSEFFAVTEKPKADVVVPGGSAGGSITGGAIFDKSIENEIRFKDTNPVLVDVSKQENTLSKSILDAINDAESGKVIKVIFKEGEISITKEQLKGVALDKKSYTYAEIKALLEKPEVTPTPTPTPTEKPTEPTEPTAKKCWLCGACPMFLGICLWIWLAIAVVAVAVVVVIVVKKKKKNDNEENENDGKTKKE